MRDADAPLISYTQEMYLSGKLPSCGHVELIPFPACELDIGTLRQV